MWYKNIRAQNLLILFITASGLISTYFLINRTAQLSLEERFQIELTVVTDIIESVTEHPDKDPAYFFISIGGEDPSPD